MRRFWKDGLPVHDPGKAFLLVSGHFLSPGCSEAVRGSQSVEVSLKMVAGRLDEVHGQRLQPGHLLETQLAVVAVKDIPVAGIEIDAQRVCS